MDIKPLLVVLLFSTSMLAGCFGEDPIEPSMDEGTSVYPEPLAPCWVDVRRLGHLREGERERFVCHR